jgi:uncharacterized membrane protein YtjA (UPF0391 family)
MLRAFFVFVILGLFSTILGLSGFGGLSLEISKLLFFAFIVLIAWGSLATLFFKKSSLR